MKQFFLLCNLFFAITLCAQDACPLVPSKTKGVSAIDRNDMACIAKNSGKKNTLFFTFGVWCEPCRLHLPDALKLAKEHDVELFVVLVEKEDDQFVAQAVQYLKEIEKDVKILVLKDAVYGSKRSKKNKKFVAEITPAQFENIDDYSKFILFDKEGNVIMVTNWKDYNGEWKNGAAMVQRRILPLL